MLRVLTFLGLVVTIGSGLAFIAAQSGEMVLLVAGQRIVLPLFTAVCLLLGALAVILLLWWLVRVIVGAPTAWRSHFGARRASRGYQALNQGLIAAMSGDVKAAKRLTKQSMALLTHREALLLPVLEAETKRLELDYQAAEEIFQSMLDEPQTRLIGLKGLYREAIRKGDEERASLYASQAFEMDATLEWAVRAHITQYAVEGDWGAALRLFEYHEMMRRKAHRLHEKSDMANWHVVLMTAFAHSLLTGESVADAAKLAQSHALRAHKLAPDFVPAAIIAAKSSLALGDRKRAEKLIENFWRQQPHPDLGKIYLDMGGSDIGEEEKLRRALRLEKLNPQNPVSKIMVAQTALQAGDAEKARQYGEDLATQSPSENVFLLLAEAYTVLKHDESTIRHYLTQAVQAEPDMAWMADGQILAGWVALSPLSHRLGVCQWQRPVKHGVPLLALPAAVVADRSQPEPETPITQPSQTKLLSSDASEIKEAEAAAPASPVFLTAEEPVVKKPRARRSQAPQLPPTRIIVDDPGIPEEESDIRS